MKTITKHLEKLRSVRRESHSRLIHEIHKKYRISKKTLFYVKEYGPHANVPRTIIRESLKIMLLASILSSLGGFMLENIKAVFLSIVPLVILMPVLNDMIGDYGTIVASRFSTMLHEGKIRKNWWLNRELSRLFIQIFIVAVISLILSSVIAFINSSFLGYSFNLVSASKIFFIVLLDTVFLISLLILIAVFSGLYFYRKQEDPNNLLIPIITSVSDFGNIAILSILVLIFF